MFEELRDKIYSIMPTKLYCFYMENIRPTAWKNKYRKHKMDKKYGFNTDETWDLNMEFYKWLQPRLKCFREVNNGYPNGDSWESWCKALDENIDKLDLIIKFDDGDSIYFPRNFLSEEEIKEVIKKYGDGKTVDTAYINQESYYKCRNTFNKWFGENVNKLWW